MDIMPFGKYKGKNINEIFEEDTNYKIWLKKNINIETAKRYPNLYNILHKDEEEYINYYDENSVTKKLFDKILLIDDICEMKKNGMSKNWEQPNECISCGRDKYNPVYYFFRQWNICKLCASELICAIYPD